MFHASLISIFASISILFSTSFLHAGDRGSEGWTIVNSYQIPEGASGLAWDGTNIYFGIYGVDGGRIYRMNPSTGIYTPQFVGDHEDAF